MGAMEMQSSKGPEQARPWQRAVSREAAVLWQDRASAWGVRRQGQPLEDTLVTATI